jgi:phage terminase large subunit GpA-like protein
VVAAAPLVLTPSRVSSALPVLRRMSGQMRVPRLRTIREFTEQEIILPTGPHQGRRFRVDRNPFAGLLLDALDSPRWLRKFVIGVQQSGKTLLGSLAPLMYHLFERKETVVYGIPSRDMIKDKWHQDILPVIAASRYRDLLPRDGQGSRGGDPMLLRFNHGPALRFMTAGGNDKGRAGFTSRVLIVTEVDGFDEIGGRSRETDKFNQLEGRVRAFTKSNPLVYGECTVSYDTGRIWREYTGGTESRLAIRCPHCLHFVTPAREQLVGWQGAADVLSAGELSRLCCPECGTAWTESDRAAANREVRLVHKGQTINDAGEVLGDAPRTDTLGFRWTAANNLLVDSSDVGKEEWRAKQDPDEENAEKKLLQFVWALPHKPEQVDLTSLDASIVAHRVTKDARGRVPSDAYGLTIGLDVGHRYCHWAAIAWRGGALPLAPHVCDYDVLEMKSDTVGREAALLAALRDFRDDVCEKGFESDDGPVVPDTVLIDSGWAGEESEHLNEVIYAFCRESNEKCGAQRYLPAKGWGSRTYRHPRKKDARVREIGDEWYGARIPKQKGLVLVHVNADAWKTRTHNRLRTPIGQGGAMTLFNAPPQEHTTIGKHLTAEKQEEDFIPGRGRVVRWRAIRRANHFLDAATLAQAAGNRAGLRLLEDQPPPPRSGFNRSKKSATPADLRSATENESPVETESAPVAADPRVKGDASRGGDGSWFSRRGRR